MLKAEDRSAEINAFMSYALSPRGGSHPLGEVTPVVRCSRCIASSAFAVLDQGLCDLCRAPAHDPAQPDRDAGREAEKAALHEVLATNCGRGAGRYDAVVMFSGGKDSTYLVHRLSSDYPDLRLLAVTIDSGFASPVALDNVSRIVAKFRHLDSMILRPRPDLFYRAFRYAITHPIATTSYLAIDLLDGELTFDIGRNLAATLGAPLFIAGTSTAQIRLLHGFDWFERPREQMLAKRSHTRAGYAISDLSSERDLEYWWDGTKWPETQVPRNILPFHAWDYDEQHVQREVVRLGYLEPGNDNPLITNNLLIPLMVNMDIARFGYCGFEPEFALLAREGRTDRALWASLFDAATHLAMPRGGGFLPKCVDDVLARLDLTREEVGLTTAR